MDAPAGSAERTDEPPLPEALFERIDTEPDDRFYAQPRLVQHIDPATIAALSAFYGEILTEGADVLDLMSSWVSHLPPQPALGRVAGLGMNAEELAANPRLTEHRVQDLNLEPALPWGDGAFDLALIAVSIQYLVQPVAVFAELARVLRPGGSVVVSTSHRCFPTKAVRAFHVLGPAERLQLIGEYARRAGGFEPAVVHDRSPADADPLWIVTAERAR